MSLKVISHLVIWPSLLVVGGILLLTPKDILRQPILPAAEPARPVAVAEADELDIVPATLTVTYATNGPVNGPSLELPLTVAAPRVDEVPVDRRWITAQALNLRTGPSVNSKHIASLPFGTEVEVLELSGNWAHVDVGDLSGWLSLNFLSADQPGAN